MNNFSLREMQPTDSEELGKIITDTSGMVTEFVIDPFQAMMIDDQHRNVGVVAEAEGYEGLVGLAIVSFGEMQFEGEILPYAHLSSLKVREDFRKQGLGARLAQWRVERARNEFGEQGVITTGMLSSNLASRNTAKKWCREYFEPLSLTISPIRKKAPSTVAGMTVREAEINELEEIVAKQNQFYKAYNLYSPQSPENLSRMLYQSPLNKPLNCYHVVVDQAGNIIAGAKARNRSLLMVDRMLDAPLPMRLVNSFLHIMPSDFTIRGVDIESLWYLPGASHAAAYLWEFMRWHYRDTASMISMPHEMRTPLIEVLPKNAWYIPKIQVTLAIHGPKKMSPERLVYASPR